MPEGSEESGTWVPVEVTALVEGDRVRVTDRRTEEQHVGTVLRRENIGVRVAPGTDERGDEWFSPDYRRFERWTPADRWERVEDPTTLQPGEYVRAMAYGEESPGGEVWREGTVGEVTAPDAFGYRYVRVNPQDGIISGCDTRRPYFRRVTADAESEYRWVPIEVSALREGMYVRGTPLPAYSVSPVEGQITEFRGENEVRIRAASGQRRGFLYIDRRAWEHRVTTAPTGWVPLGEQDELPSRLKVGDVVRAVPHNIGGRMQAEVTEVFDNSFTARTVHVIEESSNGRLVDGEGWPARSGYNYRITTADAVVWRGEAPAPAPEDSPALRVPATPAAEVPLPEWATSLDAAKRHVHSVIRRLYRRGDNCYDGSRDVTQGLDLPNPDEDYPAPPDESELIRSFLAKVREVSLSVADDHGKNRVTVEAWLEREGIVAPPPPLATHTLTFQAPPDADVRRVLADLGWIVQL